jgi:hypothetical protein
MKLGHRNSLGAALLASLLAACTGGISADGDGDGDNPDGTDDPNDPDAAPDDWAQLLEEREFHYPSALRTASLRLVGDLPTAAQIASITDASGQEAKKAAYEAIIDELLDDPRFGRQMFYWWQDTLKLGDTAEFDGAAGFAANLAVTNGSYMDLLTATSGQCGSFDVGSGTYTPGDCGNGGPQVGLLTHPGMLRQFYGNLAFRRTRWVQETFACTKFPAEFSDDPQDVGGAAMYTGLFPFESVAGLATGRVDFQDASSVVCANCHSTMNHIAPLFAYYDMDGINTGATMSVPTPLPDNPPALISDYLTDTGESLAWRFGDDITDMTSLGAAMVDDPAIAECAVARAWNWALGKGDVVEMLELVPPEVIQQQIDDFVADNYGSKDLLRAVFTADDFVKF